MAERLGGAFDVLGVDRHGGQLLHERAAFDEADHRSDPAHHARDGRRERRALKAQRAVTRIEARFARVAVVVGAFEGQLAQRALHRLGAPARVPGLPSAAAGEGGAVVVGRVGVESLLHGPRRDGERTSARGRLDRLEVQPVDRARAYERFDLGDDLRVEGFFAAPFLAASCAVASGVSSWASAHCSQASQRASTWRRNCWPAAIC